MSVLISGPVGIDVLYYQGIKFILFSDRHFSLEGICDVPTQYTVPDVISKIIRNAEQKGQYVDVYLEAPYGPVVRESYRHRGDPLGFTVDVFFDCLYNKIMCPYKNGRFHYVNVRNLPMEARIGVDMASKIFNFIHRVLFKYRPNMFMSKIDTLEVHLDFFAYDYVINVMLNTPHFIGSNLWIYYHLCISSDDFVNDVEAYLNALPQFPASYVEDTITMLTHRYQEELSPESIRDAVMTKMITTIKMIRSVLLSQGLFTERYGKVMHKIRAQLYGLELQGEGERAESLRQFMLNEFSTKDLTTIIVFFRKYNAVRMAYLNDNNPVWFESLPRLPMRVVNTLDEYLSTGSLMMDLYTLARMFRVFPAQFRTKNKPIRTHISPSYIIEYAGAFHIENIIRYLITTGAQIVPFDVVKVNKRCLSVPASILE